MKKVIESAKPLLHRSIVTFTNLRQDLFQEISEAEQMAGVKVRNLLFLHVICLHVITYLEYNLKKISSPIKQNYVSGWSTL